MERWLLLYGMIRISCNLVKEWRDNQRIEVISIGSHIRRTNETYRGEKEEEEEEGRRKKREDAGKTRNNQQKGALEYTYIRALRLYQTTQDWRR